MADSVDYLAEDFDPFSVTKPILRSILSRAGVVNIPPASAKKDELVDCFKKEVWSKRASLRAARDKVKASAKGILELDQDSRPSPSKKRLPQQKLTTVAPLPSIERIVSSPIKTPKGNALRTRSISPSKTSSPRSKSTSSRRSSPSPAAARRHFQKESIVDKKTQAKPIKTNENKITLLDSPRSVLQRFTSYKVPDSPRAMLQSLHARLASAKTPTSSLHTSSYPSHLVKEFTAVLCKLVLYIAFLAVVLIGGLYLRWKLLYPFPYCDSSNQPGKSFLSLLKESPLQAANLYCLPCPMHGTCRGGALKCAEGFAPIPNWLYFGHSCRPDHVRLRQTEALARQCSQKLAALAGQAICSGIKLSPESTSFKDSDLKSVIFKENNIDINKEEDLWPLVLKELKRELRYYVKVSQVDGLNTWMTSTKPYIPIGCRIRMALLHWLYIHRNKLFTAFVLSIAFVWFFFARRCTLPIPNTIIPCFSCFLGRRKVEGGKGC